jgi:hypothetical protein
MSDSIIEIYKEVLEGKKDRFPKNFWNNEGEQKAEIVFKYLFNEVLKWDNKKILKDFNYAVVSKYKLTFVLEKFYNKSIHELLLKLYPKLILGVSKEIIIDIYKQVLNGKRKRFPKYFWDYKGEEKSEIIFKYLFEEVLKWDGERIIKDFNYDMVSEYKLTSPFCEYYNRAIGNILNNIYPELLNGQRLPVTDETCKKISIAQTNLSKEKRENITRGSRENRYCEEYAKKLSDTKLGESNPQHKLKAEQVMEIKRLWATGIYTCVSLQDMFEVKRQTISDIVHGRTWKHL